MVAGLVIASSIQLSQARARVRWSLRNLQRRLPR